MCKDRYLRIGIIIDNGSRYIYCDNLESFAISRGNSQRRNWRQYITRGISNREKSSLSLRGISRSYPRAQRKLSEINSRSRPETFPAFRFAATSRIRVRTQTPSKRRYRNLAKGVFFFLLLFFFLLILTVVRDTGDIDTKSE